MAESGAIRAGKAFVELLTDLTPMQRGLQKASAMLRQWGRAISVIGRDISIAAGGLAAFGVTGLVSFARAGEELTALSANTRDSVENLSALGSAATSVGGSLQTVEQASAGLSAFLLQASNGSIEAQRDLAELGTTFDALNAMTFTDQVRTLATGLSHMDSEINRAATAQRLFGGAAQTLLPILRQGAAGVDRLTSAARENGRVMSTEDAAAAHALTSSWNDLRGAGMRIWQVIGAALAPVVQRLASSMQLATGSIIGFVNENRRMIVMIAVVVLGALALGVAMVALGATFKVLSAVLILCKILLLAFNAVLWLTTSPIGIIIIAAVLFTKAWKTAFDAIASAAGDFRDSFGAIAEAVEKGDLELAFKILGKTLEVAWAKTLGAMLHEFRFWGDAIQDIWGDVTNWIEERFLTLRALAMTLSNPVMGGVNIAQLRSDLREMREVLQQEQTARDNAGAARINARQRELARLNAELNELRDGQFSGIGNGPSSGFFGRWGDAESETRRKALEAANSAAGRLVTGAQGTFSGAEAAGFAGGNGPEAQTANNTRLIAELIAQLVNRANNSGFVFG
jgi:hypothetical protein